MGIDESEVARAELRLREDRLALAEAMRSVRQQCRTTLTRPSTLVLLLVLGALAGARSKRGAPATGKRGIFSILSAMLATIWSPLVKGAAAVAIERALHRRQDEPRPVSRDNRSS